MKRRVVITGMGVKTPVGNTLDKFWENICQGKHGITRIEEFEQRGMQVSVAAVNTEFDPLEYIEKKELRRTDRFCQFALGAAADALKQSGDLKENYDPFRIGVLVGSGIGGFSTIEAEYGKYVKREDNRVSVFMIPMMISNMAAGLISIKSGYKGANFAIVTACASSNHAVGEAFHKIRDGYLDACICGGAEAAITHFAVNGFDNMTALSRSKDPNRASIPFDKQRDGFVMGEGAGILILEELSQAKARGAHIYAEVVGYGATGDAYHITSPDPEGGGAVKSMEFAIKDAGITPSQVEYINAHGTSTQINDKMETGAIKELFRESAKKVAVSSTKSMTGHLLGAAGAVEGIVCAKALEDGVIPPTVGLKEADENCDLDYVTEGARKQPITYAISNSLGFGGHNATLCFKKYEE